MRYWTPPGQRAQSREQLGQVKRFGQIVIGPAIKPADPIGHRRSGGQHQHRDPHLVLAQPSADFESGQSRQHGIQHDSVVVAADRRGVAVCPVDGYVHCVTFLNQGAVQQPGHFRLVFDHQHAHR